MYEKHKYTPFISKNIKYVPFDERGQYIDMNLKHQETDYVVKIQ